MPSRAKKPAARRTYAVIRDSIAWNSLKGEYEENLNRARMTRTDTAEDLVRPYVPHQEDYAKVEKATGVPDWVVAAIHYREADGNFRTHLHNGDSLNAKTHHVPAGRPPGSPPFKWFESAIDAIKYDGLDKVPAAEWSLVRACYEWEKFNGFGARQYHNRYSSYVWAGTSVYIGGRYDEDSHWVEQFDMRLGCVAFAEAYLEATGRHFDGDWKAAGGVVKPPKPAPPLDSTTFSPMELQEALNTLGFGPLVVDGNVGHRTRAAVKEFQKSKDLVPDGLVGPKTTAALRKAIRESQRDNPSEGAATS